MNADIQKVLASIAAEYANDIAEESRFYQEVNIGRQAGKLGLAAIESDFRDSNAVVLLKTPGGGMTVRIDGRTFVDYAQFDSKVVAPGHVARAAGLPHRPYTARDSMVLMF